MRKRAHLTQAAFADRLGVSALSVVRYEAGSRTPDGAFLENLSVLFGVNADWIVTGAGSIEPSVPRVKRVPAASLPVLGLAECGLRGWYQREPMSVTAARPGDFFDPDGFAVIAIGRSMVPAGIFEGFLCFCSPRTPASAGDAVYIERNDGYASIKVFRGFEANWLVLQGWLDELDGKRDPYIDRFDADAVRRLAPIIYVKRKL